MLGDRDAAPALRGDKVLPGAYKRDRFAVDGLAVECEAHDGPILAVLYPSNARDVGVVEGDIAELHPFAEDDPVVLGIRGNVPLRARRQQIEDLPPFQICQYAGDVLLGGFRRFLGSRASHGGGPFPSTSDGRSTLVGSLAVERFLRPVCYQSMPNELLPSALRACDPFLLRRLQTAFGRNTVKRAV